MPPFAAERTTVRVSVNTPPPHRFEHSPDGANSLIWQSTTGATVGHGAALHASGAAFTLSAAAGHWAPPYAAAVTTERDNICTPPPHDLEHEPVGAQSLITQSTGTRGAWVPGAGAGAQS